MAVSPYHRLSAARPLNTALDRSNLVMDSKLAEATSLLVLTLNAALNEQVTYIVARCDSAEAHTQRQLFGQAMAALLDIANTLYREHPGLLPQQLGGTYPVPPEALIRGAALARPAV